MALINLNLRKVNKLEKRIETLCFRLLDKSSEVRQKRERIKMLTKLLSDEKKKNDRLRREVYELKNCLMAVMEDCEPSLNEKGRYCNDCGDYVGTGCDNSDCKNFKHLS